MKPKNLPRVAPDFNSFTVGHHIQPHFLNVWHYHRAIELCYVKRSSGTIFAGDHIGDFKTGDIFLFGENLPHLTLNEKSYFEKGSDPERAYAIAIHFDPHFLGENFFEIPEMSLMKQLLINARQGLKITSNQEAIKEQLEEIDNLKGYDKVGSLLDILNICSKAQSEKLSSAGFVSNYNEGSNSKLQDIQSYIFNNFRNDLSLNTIADHVKMNPSALSRFFKRATNKTLARYLIELRIGYACKILLEDDFKNVSEVCYESGFNNLSSFNKQFKIVTGRTPSQYINFHRQAVTS